MKTIAQAEYHELQPRDQRVVDACGSQFVALRKLALLLQEQPATEPYVRSEMAKVLATMPQAQRAELRVSLRAAGARRRSRR